MSLLQRIEGALAGGLRFHEWRAESGVQTLDAARALSSPAALDSHGPYLLARAPDVPGLWGALRAALSGRRVLVILPPSSPLEEKILLRQLPPAPPAGAMLAMFTSGSTGEPKGVFHSEASLVASAGQLFRAFPSRAPTACLLPAWGMAGLVFHCLLPMERGRGHFFSREPFLEWGVRACSLFRELEVNLVTLNPFLLEMLHRAGIDPAWKGSLVSLTAPLRGYQRAALSLLAGNLPREIYGMTEAAGPVLLDGLSLGAETRLSTEHELEIRGPQLMMGYATAGNFTPADGWFSTGDVFGMEGGALLHRARIRELIDTGGRKVAPRVLEEALESLADVGECLAFGVELNGVERPGIVYTRKPACPLSPAILAGAVETHLAKCLSPELRPKLWQEIETIPRLRNGKPDRAAARRLFGKG